MHASLMVSVSLALVIGIILFFAGRKGKKLWLSTWSVGLVLCSLLYFGLRFSGYA